jgi:beta-glucosidase
MDERTLREIYLPAFKAAVLQGHVWAVMGAYNRFRGVYCCENDYLINKVLKGDWGFQGLVVSDWGGSHTTPGSVNGGLDLEMGSYGTYDQYHLANAYRDGILSGKYTMASLDDKVRRNLRVMIASHMLDAAAPGSLNTVEHQDTARKVAEEGMVLLKNDHRMLPLSASKVRTIAVIGEDGFFKFAYGGESAGIKAFYEVTGLEGILRRVGGSVNVTYSPGYHQPVWRPRPGPKLPMPPRDAAGVPMPPPRDAAGMPMPPPRDTAGVPMPPPRGPAWPAPPPVSPKEAQALLNQAVKAAKSADVVILFAGLNHSRNMDSEGSDRRDLKLPYNQDTLIKKVVEANPKTVVVLISGGPIEMDGWIDKVPAILQAWYPGMEGGNAIAEALFGDINPSGKLPCTFPRKLDDSPAHRDYAYPGKNGVEYYEEGLLVGYRWFDTEKIQPLFPFGYGLSYTRFEYSGLNIQIPTWPGPAKVTFTVKNIGDRAGAEVAQIYVQPDAEKVFRPEKELKGFVRVPLKAGESRRVTVTLGPDAFSYYDPARHGWVAEPVRYNILVGSSSRSIMLSGPWVLPSEYFMPEGGQQPIYAGPR